MKTFETIGDYFKFVSLVRNTNRYRFYPWGEEFLETLLFTAENRKLAVPKGTFFWRSQLGKAEPKNVVWEEGVYEDTKPYPYPPERMKPRIDMASEGRANPKGIPYLYLSTDGDTAMAECRPWLQSHISVGRFHTNRDLVLVDFSRDEYIPLTPNDFFELYKSSEFIEKVIWGQINKDFTEPIHRSEQISDYAPTQVIAEHFKSKGFDGLKYKSALGEGYNIALFDPNSADITDCYLFTTKQISYMFETVKDAQYSTPIGDYLDNPKASEEFLNGIKRATQNIRNNEAPDKSSDKT